MPNSNQVIVNDLHELCVSGRIDVTNVQDICRSGKALIDTLGVVAVNLSAVQAADSSSLAMLIEWLRCAKTQHKDVVFNNMPQFMLDVGRVCGLDSILPIGKCLEFHHS